MEFVSIQLLLIVVCILFMFLEKEDAKDRATKITFWVIVSIMALLVAFRPVGLDNDSENYEILLTNFYLRENYEPTFKLFAWIAGDILDSVRLLFVIYGFLSIFIKAFAINKYSKLLFATLCVWLSHFYILHDATQIRASVAIGIYYIALFALQNRNRKLFLFYVLLATTFHYSALTLIPLVFFGNKPLSKKWMLFLSIVPMLGYIMAAMHLDPLDFVPSSTFQERKEAYDKARESGFQNQDAINVFNVGYLLHVIIYYFFLWKRKVVSQYCDSFPLMMKIFACSLISFTALSFLPVMAFRINELYGAIEIFFFPFLIYTVRPLWLGKSLIAAYTILMFSVDILLNELIKMT